MIEQAFFEAMQASEGNLEAIAVLIRIESTLGDESEPLLESNLDSQLEKWGKMLTGVEELKIERLKRHLKIAILSGEWGSGS